MCLYPVAPFPENSEIILQLGQYHVALKGVEAINCIRGQFVLTGEDRLNRISKLLFPLIVMLSLVSCRETTSPQSSKDFLLSLDPLLSDVVERVRQDYVQKPDEKKMVEGAVNGLLMSLDPYSAYMNPQDFKLYKESTKGEFGGIGLEVAFLSGMVKVVAPIDDTPAQKAGLRSGDIISQVNGQSLSGLSQVEILELLHGKPGTNLELKIHRGGLEPFSVKLTRAIILVNPVKFRLEKNIGYLRVTHFNDQTTSKLKAAYETLRKMDPSLKSIVLDLRDNPGGTLEEAVSVSSLFLESKLPIVQVRGREESSHVTYRAKGGDIFKGLPVIVLINNGSASASEIVAGALRDHKRAVLVGTKTYGKGSVQVVLPLGDDRGGIKLTIARFYTPSGAEIQEKGIAPDVLVESKAMIEIEKALSANFLKAEKDDVLQRALDLAQGVSVLQLGAKK